MRNDRLAAGWIPVLLCTSLFLVAGPEARAAESSAHFPFQTCGEATLTRPGVGTAYRWMVRNDTYAFSAVIPAGLTGWSGVAPEAPFHGFTVFLGPESCVIFQIQLRVDDGPPADLRGAVRRRDGVRMIERRNAGLRNGVRFVATKTMFSHARAQEVDDGSVVLITPESRRVADERVYRQFVRSLKFGGR